MKRNLVLISVVAVASFAAGGLVVRAQDKGKVEDYEKKVKEADVPAPALAALKKLADGAAFTEFAEEVEHGVKYYEGSWKGPDGNVDALVTEGGEVVEIEESMPADKIPAGVRAAAEKAGAKDGTFERKTLYLYEVHFKKDGKPHELIFGANGQPYSEDAAWSPAPRGKAGGQADDGGDD